MQIYYTEHLNTIITAHVVQNVQNRGMYTLYYGEVIEC